MDSQGFRVSRWKFVFGAMSVFTAAFIVLTVLSGCPVPPPNVVVDPYAIGTTDQYGVATFVPALRIRVNAKDGKPVSTKTSKKNAPDEDEKSCGRLYSDGTHDVDNVSCLDLNRYPDGQTVIWVSGKPDRKFSIAFKGANLLLDISNHAIACDLSSHPKHDGSPTNKDTRERVICFVPPHSFPGSYLDYSVTIGNDELDPRIYSLPILLDADGDTDAARAAPAAQPAPTDGPPSPGQ